MCLLPIDDVGKLTTHSRHAHKNLKQKEVTGKLLVIR